MCITSILKRRTVQSKQCNCATKTFDYTMIMDQLRTVSWGHKIPQICVVNLWIKGLIFPLPPTTVNQKNKPLEPFDNEKTYIFDWSKSAETTSSIMTFGGEKFLLVVCNLLIFQRICNTMYVGIKRMQICFSTKKLFILLKLIL